MKKLFTLIVAICATTLAWAVEVEDDYGYCGRELFTGENYTKMQYYFENSTGTLTISGTGCMEDFYSQAPWYDYRSSIKKVVIEDGVQSIGDYAFKDCTTSIEIPNSVAFIGDYAFYGCTGLTSFTIPNSVRSIGAHAFEGCTGLTSIEIPNSVTSIDWYAFSACTGLTSITIPNSVTSVGDYAFYGCYSIETADINSQAALDEIYFTGGLTSIILGDGVTSIGYEKFKYCEGLTSIEISNSVTSISTEAFYGCTGLTSITIPNSVTSVGNLAFYGCIGLTSINVAEDNSKYASIDGVLYSKDKKTLEMCPEGKTGSFTIPNSVTSIGYDAFYGCTGLTSIEIPNSVTSIGERAFKYCGGLTSMTVEATNPPLCANKYGNGLGMPNYDIPLYVPAGSVDAYKAADIWRNFTNIQAIPGTGVNEATVENTVEKSEVKKIIDRNGIIYIEKDGTRYFLNGSKVK